MHLVAAARSSIRALHATSTARCLSSSSSSNSSSIPSYEEAVQLRSQHLGSGLVSYYQQPLYIVRGEGQWLWDSDGRRYLDMFGGICTVSVGHCHPKVTSALQQQSQQLWHTTSIYTSPAPVRYAQQLARKLPAHLDRLYFVNSGSEANDLAVLLARLHTQRWEVVTLRNAYHGASPFLMGATALSTWRYATPTGFGFVQAANPDPYRGFCGGARCRDSLSQPGLRACSCSGDKCAAADFYVDELSQVLQFSCQKAGPAALLIESIQGVGGITQYPRGYLRRAYETVRSSGGLCIADEVQTGFGRLGSHYWGFESQEAVPDIVTMAKSIGNGFPLAAVATTKEIADTLSSALHFNTFGGNPLACAVGAAVLEVIEEEGLQENARVVGERLVRGLQQLQQRSSVIGDVRGKGLMVGLELVADSKDEQRLPLAADAVGRVFNSVKEQGVLIGRGGYHGNVLRLQPPMCVTEADADATVQAIDSALGSV